MLRLHSFSLDLPRAAVVLILTGTCECCEQLPNSARGSLVHYSPSHLLTCTSPGEMAASTLRRHVSMRSIHQWRHLIQPSSLELAFSPSIPSIVLALFFIASHSTLSVRPRLTASLTAIILNIEGCRCPTRKRTLSISHTDPTSGSIRWPLAV